MRVGRGDDWWQSAEDAGHSAVPPWTQRREEGQDEVFPPAGGSRLKLGCGVANSDGGKATSLCRPHCDVAAPPKPFPAQKEEKKSLRRVHPTRRESGRAPVPQARRCGRRSRCEGRSGGGRPEAPGSGRTASSHTGGGSSRRRGA